jgi:hypothetical protein
MQIKHTVMIAAMALQSPVSVATISYRTAVIDEVQTESATRVGYENIMYVRQSPSWFPANNCPENYAYFNAKENPHLVATVLAARASERPIKIVVDDTLPRVSGLCQIVNISF